MPKLRKPQELLMQILCNGGRVAYDDQIFAMGEKGELGVIMHNQDGGEVPVKVDADMEFFCSMAEDIGFDALWLQICAGKINRSVT